MSATTKAGVLQLEGLAKRYEEDLPLLREDLARRDKDQDRAYSQLREDIARRDVELAKRDMANSQ